MGAGSWAHADVDKAKNDLRTVGLRLHLLQSLRNLWWLDPALAGTWPFLTAALSFICLFSSFIKIVMKFMCPKVCHVKHVKMGTH